jgi:NitT/TauT family transport system permease protein
VEANPIDAELTGRRSRAARRRLLIIYALRLLFTVVWIGSWELSTRLNWVDPFFVGMPSGVVARLWTWITEGTALGPLWLQAAVTMEEAVVGFIIGSLLGVVFGIVRSVTVGQSGDGRGARVLRRLLQRLPGRA